MPTSSRTSAPRCGQRRAGRLEYESRRRGGDRAALLVGYRPSGEAVDADPSSLAHFLTERYCLYAEDKGG